MGDERLPKRCPNAVLTAFCKKMGGLTRLLIKVKYITYNLLLTLPRK